MQSPQDDGVNFNPQAVFAYIQREYPDVMVDAITSTNREAEMFAKKLKAGVTKAPATVKKTAKKSAARAKGRA